MSNKRISLNERRQRDARGVDVIIASSDPAPTASIPDTPSAPPEPRLPARPPSARPATRLEKVTLYVRPDQVISIEEIQLKERLRTGQKPDKSDLVQEALDLLIQKHLLR